MRSARRSLFRLSGSLQRAIIGSVRGRLPVPAWFKPEIRGTVEGLPAGVFGFIMGVMIKAVAFDLDGTLTRPFLDFEAIREEIGVSEEGRSLLEQIAEMPAAERERALSILGRHEAAAVEEAELNRGVLELFAHLERHGVRRAVVTRNTEQSARAVLRKFGLSVHLLISRQSGLPLKPDPAPLSALLEQWRLRPFELLMVGDYRYDLESGKAAGVRTCLVTNGGEPRWPELADHVVNFPGELIAVLAELGVGRGPEERTAGPSPPNLEKG